MNNQTEIATSKPLGSLKFLLDEQSEKKKEKKKTNKDNKSV